MKLLSLTLLIGSLATAASKATVSFTDNTINSLQISAAYSYWQFLPGGDINFPAQKLTTPIYTDANFLQAVKFDGRIDYYEPQSDATFGRRQFLTLTGPHEFPPQPGSIIHIDDEAKGIKTEWKLKESHDSAESQAELK